MRGLVLRISGCTKRHSNFHDYVKLSNATVRCLSNLKLGEMLVNRHFMSQTVREEVSSKSQEWGYRLGSIYIRKVHFRDAGMIRHLFEGAYKESPYFHCWKYASIGPIIPAASPARL